MKARNVMRLFGLIVLGLIFAFALPSQAVEYGGIGGRPAFPDPANPRTESIFIHTVSPSQVVEEGIKVVNNTAENKTLLIYAVDSVVSTDGAFACAQAGEGGGGVGSWIKLEKNEVLLEPLTNETIPFKIQVPDNASVGEHNGCIVIQEKKVVNPDEPEKAGIQLSFRTGLRVALLVPGDIVRQLQIVDFTVSKKDNGSMLLRPSVSNTGNVSVDADVKVDVKYFFGLSLMTFGGQNVVLRGDTSIYNYELKKPFWGGWYKSTLTVEYDANLEAGVGIKSGKNLTLLQGPVIWFYTTPTAAGLAIEVAIFLLILVLLFFWYIFCKRKNWIKTKWVEYLVQADDDIKKLAEIHKVSWKILVKANKLQAPYTLTIGQKIKVPPQEE